LIDQDLPTDYFFPLSEHLHYTSLTESHSGTCPTEFVGDCHSSLDHLHLGESKNEMVMMHDDTLESMLRPDLSDILKPQNHLKAPKHCLSLPVKQARQAKKKVIKKARISVDKRVKKDALWKQLIRNVRHYYQDIFMREFGKGIDHWDHKRLVSEILKFSTRINLKLSQGAPSICEPHIERDPYHRNLAGLLMFVRTTIHKNPPEFLQTYVSELKPIYWKVFTNNNNKLLEKFFKEEVILQLWSNYPSSMQVEYLSKLDQRE
jgi:hypothetical protein